MRLQGDVCALATSDVLTLPGSQIKGFIAKKREMEEPDLHALLGQLIVTFGESAAGVVWNSSGDDDKKQQYRH